MAADATGHKTDFNILTSTAPRNKIPTATPVFGVELFKGANAAASGNRFIPELDMAAAVTGCKTDDNIFGHAWHLTAKF